MDAAEQNKYNIRQMAAFSSYVLNLFQSLFRLHISEPYLSFGLNFFFF